MKWISLGGESFSLDQIENEIIRPGFKDARIHFAVNCAAKSCPPLHNEALTAQNVQAKLDSLTEAFINNGKFNLLEGDVRISRIFEWYQADFGILSRFINKYAQKKIPENVVPGYLEYDWALNE
ncbi:MAG: DUF547 domain-containing protein [Saprospiraceae bacterium]|nr:DUF547 domain-containing protein [Saprospiraceae bacterium]